MICVVDVGNTNIVFGFYKADILICKKYMSAQGMYTSDEMAFFIKGLVENENIPCDDINGVIISTVIPRFQHILKHAIQEVFKVEAYIVHHEMKLNITLPTNENGRPGDIGPDRIVNGVAAMNLYKGPRLVIDYGTANKYDFFDENGHFLTGITSPGIGVRAKALFNSAALLSEVELKRPNDLIALETVKSVQGGIIYGTIGETEYMIKHIKRQMGVTEATVIATGGYSDLMKGGTKKIDIYNIDLTLYGLLCLYKLQGQGS